MNREAFEEMVLAFGVLAISVGLLLVVQSLSPGMFDKLTGRATLETRVNVVGVIIIPCNTTLEPGWNLISLFCVKNGQTIASALAPIDGEYVSVFEYEPGGAGTWHAYNPSLPVWTIQDLATMSRFEGYWIYVPNETVYYNGNGSKRLQSTIQIDPGWNLIGYPTNETRPVNFTIQTGTANITQVRAYNISLPSFVFYPPTPATDAANTSLRDFTPYWGYWAYSNNSGAVSITW